MLASPPLVLLVIIASDASPSLLHSGTDGKRLWLGNQHVYVGFDLLRPRIDVLKERPDENLPNLLSAEGIVLEYEPYAEHGAPPRRPDAQPLSTPLVPQVLR